MTNQQIEDIFTYHKSTEAQAGRYATLRFRGLRIALAIQQCCPESREKALAITSLQQAIMWANAAIAIHEAETSGGPK